MAEGAPVALPFQRQGDVAGVRVTRVGVIAAVGAITALAAVLRFVALGKVGGNPFYDAAVRSMSQTPRNFLFGAFDPAGTTSIDKPPVDLWLQVLSTELFGYNPIALKIPEALGGTLAVPLLYDAVRRAFGTASGLGAALALALLPEAVLTGRSDTMDAVMALLIVAALWCIVRAGESGQAGFVIGAAICLGAAFNVKLFEAFIALPALAVGAALAIQGSRARRAAVLAGATFALLVTSLSWLTLTTVAGNSPFAIGSTNGSPWNAAFVFNGTDRVGAAPKVSTPPTFGKPHKVTATADLEPHLSITTPGVFRLFPRRGPVPIPRFGLELIVALGLGLPALFVRRREGGVTRAAAVALAVWIVFGTVFFSNMHRLHPRYLEALTPAVAAGLGVGIAWLARARGRVPLFAGAGAVAIAAYATWATFGDGVAVTGLGATLVGTALVAWAAYGRASSDHRAIRVAPWGLALVAAGLLATPFADAIHVVSHHLSDSGSPGSMPPERVARLSDFLIANQSGAPYEFAAVGATQASELIVHDAEPVLILTTFNGRVLTPVSQLAREVARGRVHYALLGSPCFTDDPTLAACSVDADWIRHHGIDVSDEAGVYPGLVYELGPRAEAQRKAFEKTKARVTKRREALSKIARHELGPKATQTRSELRVEREERLARERAAAKKKRAAAKKRAAHHTTTKKKK